MRDRWIRAEPVARVLEAHRRGESLRLATSSGTALVRSTGSWWASFEAYADLTGVGPGARLWVPGPLGSTMNLFAAVHAAVVGATLSPDAGSATHALLTPAAWDREDALPAGAVVTVAGGPLTARAAGRRPEVAVRHYYGAAELSFVAAGPHAGDLRAFPGAEVDVRDGEVWVRSPYLCDGYADGARGPLRRDGEWATVGDRGRLDGDLLSVLGRPGWVQTAGATVAIADMEAPLADLAAGGLVVVALTRADVGEVVAAVVTEPADVPGLRRAARSLLPSSQRPRVWLHLPVLPLTEAGKIDRDAITREAPGLPRL